MPRFDHNLNAAAGGTPGAMIPFNFSKPSETTMSSREIAGLVDKRHDNVKRTIETLAEAGVIVRPQIEDEPDTDAMGRTRVTKVYVFSGEQGKRDSIVVVAQLCPEFTARLVDRWQELEAAKVFNPAALSRMDILQLAVDAERECQEERAKRIQLEYKVEEDAPKVAFAEQVTKAPDAITLAEAAKIAGTGRNRLSAILRRAGWITRHNEPYQSKIEAGLLDVKLSPWQHPTEGMKSRVTALVTGKGLPKIVDLVRSETA
ncbi:phage antirepressor KilAC domain-containing protein [Rhizorhabdus histidinilytica]|uniref:phage antirepressor KilAC domain-containing protein n=1 Tax=Rhizorhabdus histidinilytica TaxID=439228 RepID=UPI0032206ADE